MWEFLKEPGDDPARGIGVGFTDRDGGVTPGTGGSLSFGASDGGPEALAENLRRLCEAVGIAEVVTLHQVHSPTVITVTAGDVADWDRAAPPDGDALVAAADVTGVALAVRAADCVPVVLADPGSGTIGVAHAGRVGLLAGVVPATVAALRALGATHPVAWIGPHIHGADYEVPAAMAADAARILPVVRATTSRGTPAIDLTAGVRAQLADDGIPVLHVGPSTLTDPGQHSYRRDGAAAGRQLGLVWRA